jgi:hypothetical protein
MNLGGHSFAETAASAGVAHGLWGWGVTAFDADHDGDLDIAEVNGWEYFPQFDGQPALLFLNHGDATFTESGASVGMDHVSDGRGLNRIDYDNDGDQDLLIFSRFERLTLLRNDLSGPGTNWVRVLVETRERPDLAPLGIGARVSVSTAAGEQVRIIDAGPSFLGNDELSAHFGLGGAETVDRLDVAFHDGTLVRLEGLGANRTVVVSTPACRIDYAAPFGVLDLADIQAFIGYFVEGHRTADLAAPAGVIDLADVQAFVGLLGGCG